MAFRASLRLAAKAGTGTGAAVARSAPRRLYTQAAAALPNPDPTEDSRSARLVADYAPYMVATYSRPPPVFVKGKGSYLWDSENRKYLDLTAGIAVNSLGHCDPISAKLIAQQASSPPPPLPPPPRLH